MMKRVRSLFVFLLILSILFGLSAGCSKEKAQSDTRLVNGSEGKSESENPNISKGADVEAGQAGAAAESSSEYPAQAHLLLYTPDKDGKYLVASEVFTNVDKSIEETIVKQLLPKLGMSNVKVLGVTGMNGRLTVKLSKEFIDKMLALGQKRSIAIYSIVNSLTELNGVMEVKLSAEPSNKLDSLFIVANGKRTSLNAYLKRDRSWFNRNKKLSPSEALRLEMTYEQKGQWLKAYLFMSDDQKNIHRKYYDVFYKELEEMKANGFLYTEFRINGHKINTTGDKARVEVQFINRINSGYAQDVDKVYFNTVKVDGAWMVDWLTTQ